MNAVKEEDQNLFFNCAFHIWFDRCLTGIFIFYLFCLFVFEVFFFNFILFLNFGEHMYTCGGFILIFDRYF